MADQQLLREIILHMKNKDEIDHFCHYADGARELCEQDLDIKEHISNMDIQVPRMSEESKEQIRTTYRSALPLPFEMRKKVVEKIATPVQLAMECYKNPKFSILCKDYRQSLCKETLVKSNYNKDLANWDERYCYLLEELIKLIRIINRNSDTNLSLSQLIRFVNSANLCLNITESDFNTIPTEIINFIQKNREGNSDESYPKEILYDATKSGDLLTVDRILKKFFVPIEVKNDLIKIATDLCVAKMDPIDPGAARRWVYPTKREAMRYMDIIDYLLINGASDVFYVIRETIKVSNIYLLAHYSSTNYLIHYALKECIITDQGALIGFLTDYIRRDSYPYSESRRPNLRNQIDLPKLIALIYYLGFNHLLPFFLNIASENDVTKARILYETPGFEDTLNL